jgi:hypothetical protein
MKAGSRQRFLPQMQRHNRLHYPFLMKLAPRFVFFMARRLA